MKATIKILGVMTGTSCDGLDAACVSVDAEGWEAAWASSAPYPAALRKRVLAAQRPGARLSLRSVLELQRDLGEWYGIALGRLIAKHDPKPDLIANHGQTIAHFPAPGRKGMTLQAGDPTRIAYLTGLTTVASFRDGDLSAGGQGAPLVPWFHRLLASHIDAESAGTAIHNIGGISNFTWIGPSDDGDERAVLAFDTGPGNIWIDAAAELASRGRHKMDTGGRLALLGDVDERAIRKLLRHPYFRKAPPKSTGRDEFPFKQLLSATRARNASLVATATAFTVESIALAYERFVLARELPLETVHVSGGGGRNPVLMTWLHERLSASGVSVVRLDDSGFNGRWIEAQAFAFFGLLSVLGQPIGGAWTGTREFAPPGHIIPGKNWTEVLSKFRDLNPGAPVADAAAKAL